MKLRGNKMLNKKIVTSYNDEFGEQCRKALEKSYGSAIPMPKCNVPNEPVVSTPKNLEVMPKFKTNRVRNYILVLTGVVSMVCALGIASDFFALPIFSAFFFISYETAHQISYIAATVGGLLLLTSIIIVALKAKKAKL
jgi:hypothetical protein